MNGENSEQPIIVKKGKKGHGHHGGAWKVAYADFVTAMMALFIVLWVLSQSPEIKEEIAAYFKDPVGYEFVPGKGKGLLDQGGDLENQLKNQLLKKENETAILTEIGRKIKEEIKENPQFSKLADQVSVEIVDEGLKLEMLETANDVFFEIGTSKLNSRAEALLRKIGGELSKLENTIIIQGHTDSRPFQSGPKGYTNFELSVDRANSARRSLVEGGLQEAQIEAIRGYADKRLRNKENPYDVVNRRIDIIVKYSN